MKKIAFNKLRDLGFEDKWKVAVIVFTEDSFSKFYTLEQRSYEVRSDNKGFTKGMTSNSIFGSCIDGTDQGVRLDNYMSYHDDPEKNWKVDYCYIIK